MVPESLCAFLKELIRVWKRVEITMGYESSVEAAMCKVITVTLNPGADDDCLGQNLESSNSAERKGGSSPNSRKDTSGNLCYICTLQALSGGEYDGVCAAHSRVEMFVHKVSVLYLEHWSFWLWLAFVSIALGGFLIRRSKAAVLLLDFECFNPPDK